MKMKTGYQQRKSTEPKDVSLKITNKINKLLAQLTKKKRDDTNY